RLSATAPDGFLSFSHAGDDWRHPRDHVRRLLGIPDDAWKREPEDGSRRGLGRPGQAIELSGEDDDRSTKIAAAVALWRAGVDPRGTPVETYLHSRGLELGDEIVDVLRWHPGVGAMIGLFRNIETNRPQAVSRTFLDRNALKIERKFLGPVRGCAVKLDANDTVLGGLCIGEGVETGLAARQLG